MWSGVPVAPVRRVVALVLAARALSCTVYWLSIRDMTGVQLLCSGALARSSLPALVHVTSILSCACRMFTGCSTEETP
jgi:hypothetical protein